MVNCAHRRYLRTLLCIRITFVFPLLSQIATAGGEAVGKLTPAVRKANEFTFRNGRSTFAIPVLASDLIRVRAVHARFRPRSFLMPA